MLHILVIINPNSRNGNEEIVDTWLNTLRSRHFNVESVVSESEKHTCDLIKKNADSVDLVILAGGDGTMSSAAPALLASQIPFGILPLGTANDLARSIGLDNINNIDAVCDAIEAKNFKRLDLGTVNEKYFFNVAHIGLAEKVSNALTSDLKKFWGVFSYLRAFFKALKKRKGFAVSIRVGDQEHTLRSIQVAVGNGKYYGGGNLVDAQSQLDDGLLRVYSIEPVPTITLLGLAPYLRFGKHLDHDEIFCTQGAEIIIQTKKPMVIYADGEKISETPATFKCNEQAVSVLAITPRSFF